MEMDERENFLDLLEADQNDPEIQYRLGLCYLRGEGTEQDGAQGETWLRWAAQQGHAQAQAMLEDLSGPQDEETGGITEDNLMDWCAAAEDGDPEAQYQVAVYFLENNFSGDDAQRYLTAAAEQGHAGACLELGLQLVNEGDVERGTRYLRNAADCGDPDAMDVLGQVYAKAMNDLEEAERWFIAMAEHGGGEYMLRLASRYRRGDDVPQSLVRAMSWLKKAELAGVTDAKERYQAEEAEEQDQMAQLTRQAEAGDLQAQIQLGVYYCEDSQPLQPEQGVFWLEQAAQRGEVQVQNYLSTLYREGALVPRDLERAAFWCQESAQQGDATGQVNLGRCYSNGEGVPREPVLAFFWYEKAAQQGLAVAQGNVALCYAQGEGTLQNDQLAAYWHEQAARQGYVQSQRLLGVCYEEGRGVPRDLAQAFYWFEQAARQGDGLAQEHLGVCYSLGMGVEQDLPQAADWFELAAQQGLAVAQYNLGVSYAEGWRGVQDLAQAAYWYEQSAGQGLPQAQNDLAGCYFHGNGVEKDPVQAVYWYTQAAQSGYAMAQYNLGTCYLDGVGVPQDWEEGQRWRQLALDNGFSPENAQMVSM